MIIKHNVAVYDICWLNHAKGGIIKTFYEPESKEELIEVCRRLYKDGKKFDLIGHTSNIYFLPNYNVDIMVSTRKVKDVQYEDKKIIADCGASVSTLARNMVKEGIKGFDGLIDLPGTVAASVYGNASCFGCSINALLESFELLKPNGEIILLKPEDLKLERRSSALKRGEMEGIILSVCLKKDIGDLEMIKLSAERHHQKRISTQPAPKDNLGSIYKSSGGWSRKSIMIRLIANCFSLILLLMGKKRSNIKREKIKLMLSMLGEKQLQPYVYGWNRYIWKDEKSHDLFWKFHYIHQKLFKKSDFEIEIKGKL